MKGDADYDEFAEEIAAAFPDEDWDEDRLMALKEAIKICVASDYSEGKKSKKKGGDEGLALVFGG